MAYHCYNCGNMPGSPSSGMDDSRFCTNCDTELNYEGNEELWKEKPRWAK